MSCFLDSVSVFSQYSAFRRKNVTHFLLWQILVCILTKSHNSGPIYSLNFVYRKIEVLPPTLTCPWHRFAPIHCQSNTWHKHKQFRTVYCVTFSSGRRRIAFPVRSHTKDCEINVFAKIPYVCFPEILRERNTRFDAHAITFLGLDLWFTIIACP